ncbi:MAG: branched-chain amino acid ABC transporter permease [Rhodospirillales bacterium]|nr:branched-chain amino acid ABC transporter permease [Rhodospirillales bacterium]MCY4003093.1 branched-chain amino acid ABC transporter permease [Rhodospirillales bacterium]MCY4098948.1 branched-chain amino acid ABC transporter permease [Rhodospirillales bacterium]MDE0373039.1 branched-chain amino acid ABC transporter permease [Rhodospirillales bacterium]MXX22275.1 branched-chain amino acid ABC transporter permease [Rhodospirillales bacterium]
MDELYFFLEVLIGGLLSGTLYSLVALGFVLIYKASGIFNFAQGTMVLFAALTFVGVLELGAPALLAAVITLAVMVVLAFAVERFVFRHMVNQPQVILFMATIGLAYFLEGLGQTVWGTEVHVLDLGIPDRGLWLGPILVSQFDLVAAAVVALLVAGLGVFFRTTTMGRALRGVADDHQAALSIGIPLHHVWVAVWSVAGFVALVAGLVWGSKLGVQFSISLVALKAIPVMIIGGFTSIPGAIVGGLIVGASEKLAEVYLGPFVGGGLENWFPYMLAMVVLMVRPEGLFGEKIIERV